MKFEYKFLSEGAPNKERPNLVETLTGIDLSLRICAITKLESCVSDPAKV